MRYIKLTFALLVVVLAIVFIVQNRVVLEHSFQLRFDIMLVKVQTELIPVWVLLLFGYFLGAFTAFLYFVVHHLRQRQTIRHLRQNLEVLNQELKRAGVSPEGHGSAEAAATSHD